MNYELQKYLQQLNDKNIDKNNIIMNIGLLIEKNNSKKNPTDYNLLLPLNLINLSITSKDIDELVIFLLELLKQEPKYSCQIVWSIGKTFDENKVELLLLTIKKMKYCDEETFKQVKFVIDVINNERINQLFNDICLLRNN